MRRMADVRRVERRLGDPADGEDAAAARELARERQPGLDLRAASARGSTVAVPGCVGTTFHSSTSSSSSSSARTRWTIVAVASPGPSPVSWRSEVNGMPETRAPR